MRKWTTLSGPRVLAATALLAGGCTERVGPDRVGPAGPELAVTASPIALDQVNGTFNERGTVLVKGFNPTNPHVGDAILATFFWIDPTTTHTNIITSVTDRLANTEQTPVGNTYTLVEFVSDGDVSMATYLATNVQNFPDGVTDPVGDQILAVQANLAVPVVDGGLLISAWTGVNTVSAQALGAHRSASGTGMGTTIADPGTIPVNAGALAYAVTLSNGVVDLATPAGFTPLITQSDLFMKGDGEYDAEFAVQNTAGSVDPQWTWFFTLPSTWLASVLALNAPPPPPGSLTVTTTTTGSNLDADGYTVTVDGTTSQAIGINGSVTFTGLAAGNHDVALSGLATNCAVSGPNPVTVTVPSGGTVTVAFTVSCTATTGNLTVTTSTTGSNLDPDGYTVTVDGNSSKAIGINGSVTFTGLAAGNHDVALSGLATNCAVSGPNPVTVTVPSGGTVTAAFTVSCAATTGNLTVTTSTTGSNLDPDGYTVTVDGNSSKAIGINGSVTFTGLSVGSHTVVLSGVAGNCSVSGGTSRTVMVPSGGTVTVAFSVTCAGAVGGKMTGGGKLGDGRNFATFGFEASTGGGTLEWVQHCPNGVSSGTCAFGSFTFHGNVTPGSYRAVSGYPNCRTWSGTGTAKDQDVPSTSGTYAFTVNTACDNGEPGRGRDVIDISIASYHAAGVLTGGNIQLHKGE